MFITSYREILSIKEKNQVGHFEENCQEYQIWAWRSSLSLEACQIRRCKLRRLLSVCSLYVCAISPINNKLHSFVFIFLLLNFHLHFKRKTDRWNMHYSLHTSVNQWILKEIYRSQYRQCKNKNIFFAARRGTKPKVVQVELHETAIIAESNMKSAHVNNHQVQAHHTTCCVNRNTSYFCCTHVREIGRHEQVHKTQISEDDQNDLCLENITFRHITQTHLFITTLKIITYRNQPFIYIKGLSNSFYCFFANIWNFLSAKSLATIHTYVYVRRASLRIILFLNAEKKICRLK